MKKRSWKDGDVAKGEHAARVVLRQLEIQHPTETEIENIAFRRSAVVRYIPLHGAQGRLTRVGKNRAFISIADSIDYLPRRRWAVAHELGHLETHRDENQLELCDEQDINEHYDAGTEREANAFAAELLMPTALWEKRVDVREPTLNAVSRLADEFQVSFVAAAIRFVKLSPERCALVFSQSGKILWSAYSRDFGHWIQPNVALDPYTLAIDYFRKGHVSEWKETVSATAWLSSPKLHDDHDLVEYCRPIPLIKATISLLWIKPDSEF